MISEIGPHQPLIRGDIGRMTIVILTVSLLLSPGIWNVFDLENCLQSCNQAVESLVSLALTFNLSAITELPILY